MREGVGRRAFLQATGLGAFLGLRKRVRMTVAAPGRAPASWTLRAADAHRKARECVRSGTLGCVVFVSNRSDAGPRRLAIHGAEATLTLQETE